jgi:hypothetical protein
MTEAEPPSRYTIHVTQQDGVYEFRIPELLLRVRTTDLRDGYDRLLRRQREVIDLARNMDMSDELPPPAEPLALRSIWS